MVMTITLRAAQKVIVTTPRTTEKVITIRLRVEREAIEMLKDTAGEAIKSNRCRCLLDATVND